MAVRRTSLLSALVLSLVTALGLAAPAEAATHLFIGSAGATEIKGPDGLVVSGTTSISYLGTPDAGRERSNSLASVGVSGLVSADTLASKVFTTAITGGKKMTATSKLADLSVLNGVVRAEAVETTSTVSLVNGIATPTGSTRFVGLTIAGQEIPVDVRKNTTISVPGIASVTLNASISANVTNDSAVQISAGIYVKLLAAVGSAPAGATIKITPGMVQVGVPDADTGEAIGGSAYSSRVLANVSGAIKVVSGPTASIGMPAGGTANKDVSNSTAGLNLQGLVTTGVLTNTTNGSRTAAASRSTVTSKVNGLNILGGKIRADVLTSRAHAAITDGQPIVLAPSATFVGLVIAGRAIPANVPPNTVINVLGLGRVTLNVQRRTTTGVTVKALEVRVDTSGLGLPVGATVELAAANAWVVSRG